MNNQDIQMLPVPVDMTRVETGPIQFGDDWPGTYFRGDNAGWYGMLLKNLLDTVEQSIKDGKMEYSILELCTLRGLQTNLSGCLLNQSDE